ncbi:hypothetical protein RhiirA1_444712 [Rhizophagus irregularis]|uniref:Serine-threonine/tyrosine-protein kinase catalytic domain-containing protein n=1 Tax=Rhizophagus irregularis TaxID=588596 RepID=A0A2N0RC34_9GLOM|nr:hypothetical protein RhiirA1_444712 [Rhizophagus irregularis]
MNSNPKQRPKADELSKILIFWYHSINGEMFSYKGSKVEAIFEEDNKELREIPSTYGKNHSNIYISQEFSFSKLPNPSNSSITNSYFEEDMNDEGISDKHENCSYCNKSITKELWCNECDPHYMIDGKSEFKHLSNGSWKKYKFKSMEIILKSLDGSPKCLNRLKFYWNLSKKYKGDTTFKFYGITKNPKTKEIMMIIELTNLKSLINILTNDFKTILWKDKICLLQNLAFYLKYLHELNYFCKVLRCGDYSWILNFELFEQANEQKLVSGYIGKEIKVMFENADKEIPNIPNLYKKNPDAKYTSQVFTFSNLPKPVNSSIVISYLKETNNKDFCETASSDKMTMEKKIIT